MQTRHRITAFAIGVVLGLAGVVVAAPKGDPLPRASFGAVNIATATATKVFTGLDSRNSFGVYNNGPNTIWCGWASNVTSNTGFPITAGSFLSVDVVWQIGGQDFYCIASSADQTSPANTRWIQVK